MKKSTSDDPKSSSRHGKKIPRGIRLEDAEKREIVRTVKSARKAGRRVSTKSVSKSRRAGPSGNSDMQAADLKRWRCYELRCNGYNYRMIGGKLGVSHTLARRYCEEAWAAVRDLGEEQLGMLKAIEMEKIEAMEREWLPLATGLRKVVLGKTTGDGETVIVEVETWKAADAAVRNVVKLMERRAKILGLDAPTEPVDPTQRETPEERAQKFVEVYNPILNAVIRGDPVPGADFQAESG